MNTKDKPDIIEITKLRECQEATIIKIGGCHKSIKRLADLGLTPNTKVQLIRKAIFGGPVEIKAKGTNLVLGKGLAAKILVTRP